ncbi:MAG: cupin domain-containing protein [Actinobacteria bacterium]|nr:cupin domain-containing protein [Actinomycetota bacterium]
MERWHLPSIDVSGKREPRVLFSRPECRAVLLDLQEGEEMGDHRVHERAIVEIVSGRLEVTVAGDSFECDSGTLLTFDPGETRRVRALTPARIVLLLAPWPGDGHFRAGETPDSERMPANATASPLG